MNYKILVVDDEEGIRNMTQLMLEKKGFSVITAENGVVALQKIKESVPDIILADVLMPEMDGYTFYKELKKDPFTKDVPVLIITARGGMEDSFKVVGADGFITKPVSPEDLLAEIEHILTLADNRRKVTSNKKIRTRRILSIGKHSFVLENMVVQAHRAGYQIEIAKTGSDAIAKAVKTPVDIVFIDIQMQDMTAGEIIDVLRKLPHVDEKPIIAYGYYSLESLNDEDVRRKIVRFEEDSKKVLKNGATKYIGRYNHHLFVKTLIEELEQEDE